jgi:hypothetical protein
LSAFLPFVWSGGLLPYLHFSFHLHFTLVLTWNIVHITDVKRSFVLSTVVHCVLLPSRELAAMTTTAKGRGAGGVLPINAATTKKDKSQGHKSAPRAQAPRLRLLVRRLPPGLTEIEFWNALGDEWLVGKGKVDWAAFKEGKVSRE